MTNLPLFKAAIFVVIIALLIYRFYIRSKKTKPETIENTHETPTLFYSINDGNLTELIYAPDYDKKWFDELDEKYSWSNFDDYDNRFWEYMYGLFDTLPDIAGKIDSNSEFFNNLNRPQKVFYSLLAFNGDVDNGGVSQFFFNKPEFAFAVLETWDELGMTKLRDDYEKCLNEFIGSSQSYAKRKELFNDTNLAWENRWKAFTNGYDDIPSSAKLEEYYWEPDFKKQFYKTFVDYADRNINQFVQK